MRQTQPPLTLVTNNERSNAVSYTRTPEELAALRQEAAGVPNEPCPAGRTDYEACFAPFRYCPVKGCGRMEQPQQPESEPTGVDLIAAERRRQVNAEGWTPEHDDHHTDGSLQMAAWAYLTESGAFGGEHGDDPPEGWPWEPEAWKPSDDPVRNLVKAGALIAAEIDRLLRAASSGVTGAGGRFGPVPQTPTLRGRGG